jgi:hypothetical protein
LGRERAESGFVRVSNSLLRLMGLLDSIFGKKIDKIPTPKSLETSQSEAIQSNIASFADIAKLATQADTFSQEQLESLLDRALGPGTRSLITDTIQARLRGELAPGTIKGITRYQAGRNVGALTRGSSFAENAAVTQLGGSIEAQISEGLSSAERWLQMASAPRFNAASMFISSKDKYAANIDMFNRDLMAAKMKAAPDPAARGLFDTGMALTGMVLSAYGGGSGYQGTYKPDYSSGGGDGSTWRVGGQNAGFGQSGGQWFFGKGPGAG